ncbi:NAD/FAD-binding protein-like protein [Shewanella halifaxensis HAW-EB4]|uniref:NAD/FAD-binding protein-like protein n=1 Tax=Shewanella halifaxensis (strain HAW-EB4) TaxID=458817 RepID=B0TK89_SHEHH|nr:FAD-dependent oxidoreductase [Shewanella halifaxensis]ABZ77108.1 NAD/FAD-binding protein-like protein [Shewanella halifaxensis HAW-EB4]
MKFAIIGGGASGMITAYYLSKQGHTVSVFEKQAMLGGHIRTVNKNIKNPNIPQNLILEGGVVEFSSNFKHFLSLMDELNVSLEPLNVGSAIFKRNKKRFLSPSVITGNIKGLALIAEFFKLAYVYLSANWLLLQIYFKPSSSLIGKPFADYVTKHQVRNTWLKLFTMYCFSIPYKAITKIPAELAFNIFRRYFWADWKRIDGGVYSYIEKIERRLKGKVILNANIKTVIRSYSGVTLHFADDSSEHFDKLVLAVPPDQVLRLISEPTASEVKHFSPWQANIAKTVLHRDALVYPRFGINQPSEFDFFQTQAGWGYNASLTRICNLPPKPQYSLAYNIENLIAEQNILQTFEHHTPLYSVDAFRYRRNIIDNNGANHTYHVGAYLYDGLHEGAVLSAKKVAKLVKNLETKEHEANSK